MILRRASFEFGSLAWLKFVSASARFSFENSAEEAPQQTSYSHFLPPPSSLARAFFASTQKNHKSGMNNRLRKNKDVYFQLS